MEVVAIGLILTLVKKSVDVVAYVKAHWWAKLAKVIVACVVAVGLALLLGESTEFGGPTSKISEAVGFSVYGASVATLALLGLAFASAAGVLLSDIPAAIDNKRNSASPPLLDSGSTEEA